MQKLSYSQDQEISFQRTPNLMSRPKPLQIKNNNNSSQFDRKSRQDNDSSNNEIQAKEYRIRIQTQKPRFINSQYYLSGKIDDSLVPSISAKSWVIIDMESSRIIWAKNENVRREIASLTKIMTCYLTLQCCQKLDIKPDSTFFQVSRFASSIIGTTAELQEGDILTIEDLYYAMMLPSGRYISSIIKGNDAAFVLAENMGVYNYYQSKDFQESYERNLSIQLRRVRNPVNYFIKEMNELAKKIGMTQTTFANPHGLANKYNKSTALDLAKLCIETMKDSKFRKIVNTKMHFCTIQEQDGWTRDTFWENTNRLLYHGFHGIKTGITPEAGPCLASAYKTQSRKYAIVVLGCKSTDERWPETIKLLEWAIQYYEGKSFN